MTQALHIFRIHVASSFRFGSTLTTSSTRLSVFKHTDIPSSLPIPEIIALFSKKSTNIHAIDYL